MSPSMQYITSLLSSTPPPLATTPLPKVRVDSPVVEVEYTTACSTITLGDAGNFSLAWSVPWISKPAGMVFALARSKNRLRVS